MAQQRPGREKSAAGHVVGWTSALGLLACALAVAAAPVPGAGSDADPVELLRRVERRHEELATLSASFRQSHRSAALGHEVVESGRLFVKKPRMRWDYREPDRKVFLVERDGTMLSYVPADRSATRTRLPADAPHFELLLGRSDLLHHFTVEPARLREPVLEGSVRLALEPRKPMDSIERVYLEVDPARLQVRRVLVVDQLGNESDLVLERIREGVLIEDGALDVRVPRGVEVRDLTASAEGG